MTLHLKVYLFLLFLFGQVFSRQCYDSVWSCNERIPKSNWYDLAGWFTQKPKCDNKLKWICPKSCGVCQDQNSWNKYLSYIVSLANDYNSDYYDYNYDSEKYDYLYDGLYSDYSSGDYDYGETVVDLTKEEYDYGTDVYEDYDYSGNVEDSQEPEEENVESGSGSETETVNFEENSDIPELDECADFATDAWCTDYKELCHMSVVKINCEVTCGLCRPNSVETSTTSILQEEVDDKKYKNTYLDQGTCGISQSKKKNFKSRSKRVVGGTRAKYGEHPWIAHILVEGYSNCGGSVISKSWILTAAHCIVGEDKRGLTVVAGEYHARQKDDFEQRRGVKKLILYPKYRIGSDDHDIGLMQLDKKLKFGKYVQPVCLPAFGRPVPTGKVASIMGWGETNAKGSKLQ